MSTKSQPAKIQPILHKKKKKTGYRKKDICQNPSNSVTKRAKLSAAEGIVKSLNFGTFDLIGSLNHRC